MMETFKQIGVGLAVIVVVCAGMLWVTLGPEVKAEANRAAEARGWREPFVEQAPVEPTTWSVQITPTEEQLQQVAKAGITSGTYGGSGTLAMTVWDTQTPLGEAVFSAGGVIWRMVYMGVVDDTYKYAISIICDDPPIFEIDIDTIYIPIPDPGDEATYSWDWAWTFSGAVLEEVVTTNPIGEKSATHSKEIEVNESWELPEGAEITMTVNGDAGASLSLTCVAPTAGMGMKVESISLTFPGDFPVAWVPYITVSDMAFCGSGIDTTGFVAQSMTGLPNENSWVRSDGSSGWEIYHRDDIPDYGGGADSWTGAGMSAPFSYDFSPMEFKLLDGSDAPDSLELYVTGIRTLDAGGVDIGPWHGTIADLRALGRYTQQHGCYSWDTWDPDMQAEVQMYISLTSALAHNLHIGGETLTVDGELAVPAWTHDGTVIFDCWTLSSTNRTDAPYVTNVCSIGVEGEKDIYANAHTHEDWIGANVSTPTAGGEFVVGAGGGSLALTLACNYPARQAAVGNVDAIPVPTAYRTRRHDALLGTGNPVEKPEAVWDWRGKYFLQSFKDLTLPCDLTCSITYYNDLHGCSDNHLSDSTRQTTFSYNPGPAYTLERTIRVTYADGSGWSPVLIDLYDEQNGHPVARVESIEWEFPDAGTYEMSKPTLPPGDPGDRQELVAAAPGYREAPSSSGAYVKIDEHWQYAQGVVSGHVNGLCDRVLFMPDNVKPCTVEHCFDTLNVVIGAGTGTDLTTCYSLGGWPINNAGEAWGYTYSSGAEESHMKDSDGAVLKTLAVSDIRPEYQLAAVGDVITPSVAVRAYSITCVRGLTYTFYGRKIFNGRGHGMMVKKDPPNDYPRARNSTGGPLQRRHLGSSDPWQSVEASLASDEHGHWSSAAWEIADTDAARTLWEYAVNADSMGRFATREFALLEIYPVSAIIGNLALTHHFTNAIIVTDAGITTDVGEHKIQHGPGWSSRFAVPASSGTTWANILATRARTELVEDASGTYIRLAHSLDGNWQSPVEIDAAYTYPFGIGVNNRLYISAYSNGQQYLLRHNMNATHDAVSDPIPIAASDEAPACLAYILPHYHLLCAVQEASTIKLYQSFDQGQTWALAQSLASLEYPYVFAEPDRVWVVGYASSEVQVASFFSRDKSLPAVAAAVSVGQADEGRSAIIRHPSTKELIVVVPKTTDWGLGEPALAIAEYSSTDTGQTWTRKAFHEIT